MAVFLSWWASSAGKPSRSTAKRPWLGTNPGPYSACTVKVALGGAVLNVAVVAALGVGARAGGRIREWLGLR